MTVSEFYTAIGGDYRDALSRLMNDSILKRFVCKFPSDPSFGELKATLDAGITEDAFRAAHTLKGVSANLGFKRLREASSTMTEYLRSGNLEDAQAAMPALEEIYNETLDALAQLS